MFLRAMTLAVLTFSAYSFMLSSDFKTMDDQFSIVSNPLIKDPANWTQAFQQGYFKDHTYYRPLVNLSFMAEYNIFGLNAFYYNLDNVLLHIANAFLVWILVTALINAQAGFWVALVFAIHPVHWEAVCNISGRAILLGTLFCLLSFIGYLRRNVLVALGSFAAALLCKESSAILPGIFVLYDFIFRRKVRAVWIGSFAVILLFYISLRKFLGITEFFPWRNVQEHIVGILTFLGSLLTHVRVMMLPFDLHFDRSLQLFENAASAQSLSVLGAWLIFAGVLIWGRKRISRMQWLCLGWFFLSFLPVSQLVTTIGVQPGFMSTADHFLYFASVPFLIAAVSSFMTVQWVVGRILLTGLLGYFFLTTIEQSTYAKSELAMMERSLTFEPRNARLQSSVGLIHALGGRYAEAEQHFKVAVAYDPLNPRYVISLGKSLCDQGRYRECLSVYDQIQNPGPFAALLNSNRRAALRYVPVSNQ